MTRSVLIFGLAAVLVASHASAESIWQRRHPRKAYLYVDNRARNVGDLLTVVVLENTDIENKEKRGLGKETDAGIMFDFAGAAGDMAANADLDTDLSSKREFDGKADYTSEREFTDRMTVTVIDVLPNGNLIIEGSRQRMLSGEERTLRISGVVRPSDITSQNTVTSQFIGDFSVVYEGEGPETSFTNQGWLGRIGNYVWPF